LFSASLYIKTLMYSMPFFSSKTSNIRIYELKFIKFQQFQYLAMIFNTLRAGVQYICTWKSV